MWDVSRLEVEEMFSDGRRHQSAEGEVSVNVGVYDVLLTGHEIYILVKLERSTKKWTGLIQ